MRESEKFKGIIEEFTRKTEQFADEIKTSNFTVFESDYNECNDCEYNSICRTVYRIGREKFMTAGKYDG
jgi:radical SAM protein with 4Fe4S-binding SPASM domain